VNRMRKIPLVVLALLALILAACGGGGSGDADDTTTTTTATDASETTAAPGTTAAPDEEMEPVTVEWWHIQNTDPMMTLWQTFADEFMEANPHVTINITVMENEAFKAALQTNLQAGDVPDLFQSWGGGGLREQVDAGLVQDIRLACFGLDRDDNDFVIGLIGSRIALGRMVIIGYAFTGACVAGLALTGNFAAAMALTFGAGVGNLAFVIPSQTLVQTRTPPELMGRLLGLRFTMVFGSMAIATGVGGFLGAIIGVPETLGLFGLVTVAAGIVGVFVPAVRDA